MLRSTVDGWPFARSSKIAVNLLQLENNLLGKVFLVPRDQSSECPFGVPAVVNYAFTTVRLSCLGLNWYCHDH